MISPSWIIDMIRRGEGKYEILNPHQQPYRVNHSWQFVDEKVNVQHIVSVFHKEGEMYFDIRHDKFRIRGILFLTVYGTPTPKNYVSFALKENTALSAVSICPDMINIQHLEIADKDTDLDEEMMLLTLSII
jgi:hypothetical protein